MQKVKTSDGSYTFYSTEADQCYHTRTGAVEESLKKHVEPSEILKKAESAEKIVIGDVFFGLAYNAIVAIAEIWKVNPDCVVELLAFENDYEIMHQLKDLELPEEYQEAQELMVKLIESEPSETKSTNLFKLHTLNEGKLKALLFVGDARETIKTISPDLLDVVFFDPFSPAKVPEMWTRQFLVSIWRKMKKGGVLTTYSYARMARTNLADANFIVKDGPTVGRRSPSTIAIKE